MLGKSPRPGFPTVTPYLIVPDLAAEIAFLQQAFGATEHYRTRGGAGIKDPAGNEWYFG